MKPAEILRNAELVLLLDVPQQVVDKLLGGISTTSDFRQLPDVDAAIVSTRTPRWRAKALVQRVIAQHAERSVILVLCQVGGELLAAELLSLGASHVLVEAELEAETPSRRPLAEVFEESLLRPTKVAPTQTARNGSLIPVASELEAYLGEAEEAGRCPWIIRCKLLHWSHARSVIDAGAHRLLANRILGDLRGVVRAESGEVYLLDAENLDLVVTVEQVPPERISRLVSSIRECVGRYGPYGDVRLDLRIGIAGPSDGHDVRAIYDLAQRAATVAAISLDKPVVTAAEVYGDLVTSTELQVAFHIVQTVDNQDPLNLSHSDAVATIAAEVAVWCGIPIAEIAELRLAAKLHDIGKVHNPSESFKRRRRAVALPNDSHDVEHVIKGAEFAQMLTAGPAVREGVLFHHERWDGSGFPEGRHDEEIPLVARVIAFSDFYDRLLSSLRHRIHDDIVAMERSLTVIQKYSGTAFDPFVVEAAAELFRASLPSQSDR
jgi:putative nucleotidyltransferase with HDIG domain